MPLAAKGGRLAVTITAAAFLVLRLALRVLTPSRSIMLSSDWRSIGAVAQAVARAVEAEHDAIADQLVVAHAFDIDDVLQPRAGEGRRAKAGGDSRQSNSETSARMGYQDTGDGNVRPFWPQRSSTVSFARQIATKP